jgi:excisionase family DNA binding protein
MDFTVQQVARKVGCHPNTVRRAEAKGLIEGLRDYRGWRRFPAHEVERLKRLLNYREPAKGDKD